MNVPSIFARAMPAAILCRETISYHIEIPQFTTALLQSPGKARGEITLRIPYDGYQSFSRDALDDVKPHLRPASFPYELSATIGHLGLVNYQHLELDEELRAALRHDTIHLEIPVRNQQLTDLEQLCADTFRYEIRYTYQYTLPQGLEVSVKATLFDEHPQPPSTDCPPEHDLTNLPQIDLTSHLILCIQVRLYLPQASTIQGPAQRPAPELKSFRLQCPMSTLYRDVRLFIASKNEQDPQNEQEHPFIYALEKGEIEWKDLRLRPLGNPDETGQNRRLFATPYMQLHFQHPETMLRQPTWEGTIHIRIPDFLLSGLDFRYFDATGELWENNLFKKSTEFHIDLKIDLQNYFQNRPFVSVRHLEFPELTLDENCVQELMGVLMDLGFEIKHQQITLTDSANTPRCLLKALRALEANPTLVQLLACGQRNLTRRETTIPGGKRFITPIRRGTTRITLWVKQDGDRYGLTRTVNQIHKLLEERLRYTSAMA